MCKYHFLAYITLVWSRLEYKATVWDPKQRQDVERLEKVQRQAACFITKDYKSRSPGCVSNMLRDLGLPTLEECRKHLRLNLLYRKAGDEILPCPPASFSPLSALDDAKSNQLDMQTFKPPTLFRDML